MRFSKTAEQLRRILELRRSNASVPIRNKKLYNRKPKYKPDYKKDSNPDGN